jgi:hypothetical protein
MLNLFPSSCIKVSVCVRFIIVITQFQVTMAMKYEALTHCMDVVCNVKGYEQATPFSVSV